MNFKKILASAATTAMVASSLVAFSANAGTMVGGSITMTRAEKSAASVHTFALPNATTVASTVVTYPSDFVIASANKGTLSGTSNRIITLDAGVSPDGLVVTLTSNATAAGSYMVEFTGENTGAMAIAIVNDDTITVGATVDPSITFEVGTTTAACDGAYVAEDWSVNFGHLNGSRRIASSDDSSVEHICTRLSTNATSGAVVTAKNANGALGLKSVSAPADYIPSTTAGGATRPINTTQPNYGMCYSATHGYNASSVPAGNDVSFATGVFDNADAVCTNALSGAVGNFTGTAQTVWSVAGVTDAAYATLFLKVGISATQPAHNDYADSITFVATATF